MSLDQLLHVLRWTHHSSFPVVRSKSDRTYMGLLHRDYLLCLLSLGPRILHPKGHAPPPPHPAGSSISMRNEPSSVVTVARPPMAETQLSTIASPSPTF